MYYTNALLLLVRPSRVEISYANYMRSTEILCSRRDMEVRGRVSDDAPGLNSVNEYTYWLLANESYYKNALLLLA